MTLDLWNDSCRPRPLNCLRPTEVFTNSVRSLSDCYLYGILDLAYCDKSRATETAAAMIQGGVDLIQLRGKKSSLDELTNLADELHSITSSGSVPLVVNDHPEIAS